MAHGGQSVLVVETMGFRVLEHHLTGPLAGTTTTLIDKVCPTHDQHFVAVVASPWYQQAHSEYVLMHSPSVHQTQLTSRISCLLTFAKRRQLPGFPDGITRSSDGNYWVCLVAPLSPLLMVLQLNVPFLQYLLARLMTSGLASRFIKRWGCVVKVSPKGEALSTLMDPTGEHVSTVSAATGMCLRACACVCVCACLCAPKQHVCVIWNLA